jgi:hypothetical protein
MTGLTLEVKLLINVRQFENEFKMRISIDGFDLNPSAFWAIY